MTMASRAFVGLLSGRTGFALIVVSYVETDLGRSTDWDIVAEHDTYALVDYWATMYNVGAASVERCKEQLAKGFAGVDQNSQSQLQEAKYDGQPDDVPMRPGPQ